MQELKWVLNQLPKTKDENLHLMSVEEVEKARTPLSTSHPTAETIRPTWRNAERRCRPNWASPKKDC